MNLAVPKFGAVAMMAISLMLARCTGSVSSSATTTRTTAAIRVTAQPQVRVNPTAVTGAAGDPVDARDVLLFHRVLPCAHAEHRRWEVLGPGWFASVLG